jgi:anti-sigma factor RsiW
MEELLARYLDGELTEQEDETLIRASVDDPETAAVLQAYETIIAASGELPPKRIPARFVDRVMSRIEAPRVSSTGSFGAYWLTAAALIAGLILGYAVARGSLEGSGSPEQASVAPAGLFLAVSPDTIEPGVRPMRAIHLSYVPQADDIESVSVAGSFNGWDPTAAPLQRQDGVWTIMLVLPPGEHEYMLIEDGLRWVTDPAAPVTRDDGFGNANGILEVRS